MDRAELVEQKPKHLFGERISQDFYLTGMDNVLHPACLPDDSLKQSVSLLNKLYSFSYDLGIGTLIRYNIFY